VLVKSMHQKAFMCNRTILKRDMHKIEVVKNVAPRFRLGQGPRRGSRLVWALAGQRTLQLFASVAEARMDVRFRKRIWQGTRMGR